MPVPFRRLASGTILVDIAEPTGQSRVVLYARVSSHDRRSDLDRQVSRLTGWATDSGLAVGQVVPRSVRTSRVQRPKLARVLSDPCATVIVMEHRNRLARFGRAIKEA